MLESCYKVHSCIGMKEIVDVNTYHTERLAIGILLYRCILWFVLVFFSYLNWFALYSTYVIKNTLILAYLSFISNRGHHRRAVPDTSTAASSNATAATCAASTEAAIPAFLTADTSKSTGDLLLLFSHFLQMTLHLCSGVWHNPDFLS